MLLFVYIAQGILLFLDRFWDSKKLLWLMMAGFAAFIISLTSHTLFIFLLVFYLVFFSRTCRLSDYGFSYYFTIIIGVGLTFGVLPGILIGLIPFLLIPSIRPDVQIIDLIVSSILMTLVGIIAGIFSYFTASLYPFFITIAIVMLITYNVIRFIALYGKYHMAKLSISFFLNIALNYYLITMYLPKLMEILGFVIPV
jgi:hypothetical protein